MERKLRFVWWAVLIILIMGAIWKLFLPHGTKAYLDRTASDREIVVYVTGAVAKPGLVHVSPDARLDDVLKQVRPLPEANLDALNPAERVKDGQKISVPKISQPTVGATGSASGQPGSGSGGSGTVGTVAGSTNGTAGGGSTVAAPAQSGEKININTAGPAELDKLPGVGAVLADRIIQYRTEHGPFGSPEDLQKVSGIGPKIYEKMSAMVWVGP